MGFPRIGIHRELKFEVEKYFRGEIQEETLHETVSVLRATQWKVQKEAGATFIPSNDFSLYDMMLDTAFMLNAIPKRYVVLGLSDTATYFAMARGYQGKQGDVKAYAMKKWFNTNYHYRVPELEEDMEITLRSEQFLDGYRQALSLGIRTKPVVIGPFTFLKLARAVGKKEKWDYEEAIIEAYAKLLSACTKNGVEWLQMDEPCLVLDMDEVEISRFCKIYQRVLNGKIDIRVLLQTYFGDVRDCYQQLLELPFDGIGLDFVEGKRTKFLVETYGFPKDKILFAGLVNGKNIWKCDYEKVLNQLHELGRHCENIVLGTSCSLLHVPYTIANESKLPREVTKHFSFAFEKLEELSELCMLDAQSDACTSPAYIKNRQFFQTKRLWTDLEVQNRVAGLTKADFTRWSSRSERQALQKTYIKLPLLPTTTIGSFPQTREVKQNRFRYRKGEISEMQYCEKVKDFIRECIRLQEEIGLDVLVHGEFERNDMVEFFCENLSGYVITENAWVQSYGTRGVKPPIIFGDIKRKKSITTDYIQYANSLTDREVKGMLTGPVTILNWSFPREDISIREMMYQIGLAIRDEVLELESAGVRIIQIDEAALREKLPLRCGEWHSDYLDFAIEAFRLCHAKVKPETQIHTHMCYSEFEDIIPDIDAMDADVITFEASCSKLSILDSLRETRFETAVGPGVYDIHSPRVPSVEEIENTLCLMLKKIPKEKLWVNPDCGLKTRGETETVTSLRNLVQAAKNIRIHYNKIE